MEKRKKERVGGEKKERKKEREKEYGEKERKKEGKRPRRVGVRWLISLEESSSEGERGPRGRKEEMT